MVIRSKQSGVTLIELIVVISIVALISSVLMFNYSDFSTNVSLRGLSQEVALAIRKAQTYATSVHSAGTGSYPAYGISFSVQDPGGSYEPSKKQFELFADIPIAPDPLPNKMYDTDGDCGNPVSGAECIEEFSITSGDSIVGIETDVTGLVKTGSVTITFRRPTPDAIICYSALGPHDPCIPQSISYVKLLLQSAKGATRMVTVWNTGQISVN
jgi:prepilin-type N-terminal cleavage/methylation domain-containing protein